MPTGHQHWSYVWVPLFGASIWFGTLLAMLITWLAQGRPHYPSQDGSIAYISDVGADILKPLFVVGCVITGVSFFVSLLLERWLRHSGRLIPNMRRRERVFSALAILGSFIGGLGLILLSILDTKRHPSLHRVFLLVFILGAGLSAIFTVIEFRWISRDFVDVRKLKIAYIMKGIIATILILLAIAFAVALYQATDVGAVLEWTIAFGYTFYLLTFVYDLRMSKNVHRGDLSKRKLDALKRRRGSRAAMAEVNAVTGAGPKTTANGPHPNGYTNGYTDGHANSVRNGYNTHENGNGFGHHANGHSNTYDMAANENAA